jgi:hypothetical protein
VSFQSHQQHRTIHTTSNNSKIAQKNSSASSEVNENADGDDDDDLSDGEDDLGGLNSASLRKRISSEVKSLAFLFICIY